MQPKFLLFAGATFYPSGGWGDYINSFDSVESAREYALRLYDPYLIDWAHVVELRTGEVTPITLRPAA